MTAHLGQGLARNSALLAYSSRSETRRIALMNPSLLDAVRRHVSAHAGTDGIAPTGIAGLTAIRALQPSGLEHAISRPLACLVLQGSKRVTMGTQEVSFGAGDSLLITADVPTVSQVTQASADAPYFSLVLDLHLGVIAELVLEMQLRPDEAAEWVEAQPTDAEVADAALRLMRLLDRPAALPMLQAQLIREMHYWLLVGRHGPAIGRLGWPRSHAQRVARTVALLRAEYAQPLPVERLAAVAGMSVSSFHHHFRAATSLSPRPFQKQLRLIEARRLMAAEAASASTAAFAVGYESAQQFTRDYRRMFGLPPGQDRHAIRNAVAATTLHKAGV